MTSISLIVVMAAAMLAGSLCGTCVPHTRGQRGQRSEPAGGAVGGAGTPLPVHQVQQKLQSEMQVRMGTGGAGGSPWSLKDPGLLVDSPLEEVQSATLEKLTRCSFYVGTRTAEWLVTKHDLPVDLKFYNSAKGVLHSLSKNTQVNKKQKPFVKGQWDYFRFEAECWDYSKKSSDLDLGIVTGKAYNAVHGHCRDSYWGVDIVFITITNAKGQKKTLVYEPYSQIECFMAHFPLYYQYYGPYQHY